MLERHQNEQFFWTPPTVEHLADFAARFDNPCCLCAPLIGQELEKRGLKARTLDIDERFAHLDGFQRFDVFRPTYLGENFGLILCDPPFWKVSLSQMFHAIRLLARHDYAQPLLICYLARRAQNLCGTFARFGLQPTGFHPEYVSLRKLERNEIEFFGNLSADEHTHLSRTSL